jgi:hypothetical protein
MLDLAAVKAGILGDPELQVKRILKDLGEWKQLGLHNQQTCYLSIFNGIHLENPFLGEVSPDFHNTVMSLITIVIQRVVRPKSIEGRKLAEFGLQCPVKNGPSAGRPGGRTLGDVNPHDQQRWVYY